MLKVTNTDFWIQGNLERRKENEKLHFVIIIIFIHGRLGVEFGFKS